MKEIILDVSRAAICPRHQMKRQKYLLVFVSMIDRVFAEDVNKFLH